MNFINSKEHITKFKKNDFNLTMLGLLSLTDIVFIVLHCLFIASMNDWGSFMKVDKNFLYSIENEQGYAEIFQNIKEFWIFLLLISLFFKEKKIVILIWSLLFLYLLMDDALKIHETIGKYLANYFDIKPKFKLRSVDFGELIVSFTVGLSFLICFIYFYIKSNKTLRKISFDLFILLLILCFFGIFIDMLHVVFNHDYKLGLIEDGGEMLVISAILSYVFNLHRLDLNISRIL